MTDKNLSQGKIKTSPFEEYKKTNSTGQVYWSARDLFKILDYQKWDKFKNVIDRAKEACKNSNQNPDDHFPRVEKLVQIGSDAVRDIGDLNLSRYACYLIVQNADPTNKPIVALGQTYFAVQTRKQELIESNEYNSLKTEDEKRLDPFYYILKLTARRNYVGQATNFTNCHCQRHGYP